MLEYFFPSLKIRSNQPELMDDFGTSEKELFKTLKQFRFINFFLSRHKTYLKKIFYQTMKNNQKKEFNLLDIGSGGCDIPVWFLNFLNKKSIKIKITCIDYDKRVVDFSQKILSTIQNIQIINESVFNLDMYEKFDFIFANNFLHHFNDKEISKILNLILNKTSEKFLILDIQRSNFAYFFFTLFGALFLHKSFAFFDGRLSVKKGFKLNELSELLKTHHLEDKIKVSKTFPSRIILSNKN